MQKSNDWHDRCSVSSLVLDIGSQHRTEAIAMTRTTPTAQTLLKDVGFVLAMTQKVKDAMGKPTPPTPAVSARVAARRQLVVAA